MGLHKLFNSGPLKLLGILTTVTVITSCFESTNDSGTTAGNDTQSGSTAAMIHHAGYLITLDRSTVRTYSYTKEGVMLPVGNIGVSGAETLFAGPGNDLYVGSEFGATLLNVSEEGRFELVASVSHVRACDPVITDGDYMYQTLRIDPDSCEARQVSPSLRIYDISEPALPVLLSDLLLNNPYGLAKGPDYLWVCTSDGLISVDVDSPDQPEVIDIHTDLLCEDIIIREDGSAVLTHDTAVSYVDLTAQVPVLLSTIEKGK